MDLGDTSDAVPPATARPLDFSVISARYRVWLEDYLTQYGFDPVQFCAASQPAEDEMFFKALLPNFEGDRGIGAFKFVEATMRHYDAIHQIAVQLFGGFDKVGSVLDFASGYGRLTRALVQRLPAQRIWVADIYGEAVDWQIRTFGVNGFRSYADTTVVDHNGTHDIVFVGSLFSHLPRDLFRAWLKRLHQMVGPNGVLAFSVHDETLLGAEEAMSPEGIRFFPWSESGSLDPAIYGMTYVTEAFVVDAISAIRPQRPPSWCHFPKGLYENQALYVVAGGDRDLSELKIASPPMGGFETATLLTDGTVEFAGWAIERTAHHSVTLTVDVDGRRTCDATVMGDRPDVQPVFPASPSVPVGWRTRLSRADAPAGSMVRLNITSTSGLTTYAYAEMPSDPAMTYSGWSRRALSAR
jgi:SAM-dependent methyltransferase